MKIKTLGGRAYCYCCKKMEPYLQNEGEMSCASCAAVLKEVGLQEKELKYYNSDSMHKGHIIGQVISGNTPVYFQSHLHCFSTTHQERTRRAQRKVQSLIDRAIKSLDLPPPKYNTEIYSLVEQIITETLSSSSNDSNDDDDIIIEKWTHTMHVRAAIGAALWFLVRKYKIPYTQKQIRRLTCGDIKLRMFTTMVTKLEDFILECSRVSSSQQLQQQLQQLQLQQGQDYNSQEQGYEQDEQDEYEHFEEDIPSHTPEIFLPKILNHLMRIKLITYQESMEVLKYCKDLLEVSRAEKIFICKTAFSIAAAVVRMACLSLGNDNGNSRGNRGNHGNGGIRKRGIERQQQMRPKKISYDVLASIGGMVHTTIGTRVGEFNDILIKLGDYYFPGNPRNGGEKLDRRGIVKYYDDCLMKVPGRLPELYREYRKYMKDLRMVVIQSNNVSDMMVIEDDEQTSVDEDINSDDVFEQNTNTSTDMICTDDDDNENEVICIDSDSENEGDNDDSSDDDSDGDSSDDDGYDSDEGTSNNPINLDDDDEDVQETPGSASASLKRKRDDDKTKSPHFKNKKPKEEPIIKEEEQQLSSVSSISNITNSRTRNFQLTKLETMRRIVKRVHDINHNLNTPETRMELKTEKEQLYFKLFVWELDQPEDVVKFSLNEIKNRVDKLDSQYLRKHDKGIVAYHLDVKSDSYKEIRSFFAKRRS